jgi:hypothetical protein
VIQ